ncbi:hypothetical protein HMPREF0653_01750 [Prevotella disiens JCM 6334 = ATCC 29426]|uniref:Lipoprotein n=1 Tax=Prevotella disiens JCM 6334 = ATCC 29426 TaxID=1235811 RepID=A0ABN0NR30_9BACT|nr:hypothetical protein HMPREF0653_01750 [Prevotella disiens JCM 6334 = ATCC 29426]
MDNGSIDFSKEYQIKKIICSFLLCYFTCFNSTKEAIFSTKIQGWATSFLRVCWQY